jgi:mRNA interferase MazF
MFGFGLRRIPSHAFKIKNQDVTPEAWVDFSPGKGSEPMGMRPGLVIQGDSLNDSKISTVVMLAITSTLRFGELPGNVVLNKGEARLPRKCVVNVTQIKSVDKRSIKEKIGALSAGRLEEVEDGIRLVLSMR